MRNNIHECLANWVKKIDEEGVNLIEVTDEDLKRLERELLIIITSPTAEERDQDVINRTIASLRGVLDAPNPPSARRMFEEQLNVSRMPYLEQKILQNLVAYIYREGFKAGSKDPEPQLDLRHIGDGDVGNSG
jgi:hypothetical protein